MGGNVEQAKSEWMSAQSYFFTKISIWRKQFLFGWASSFILMLKMGRNQSPPMDPDYLNLLRLSQFRAQIPYFAYLAVFERDRYGQVGCPWKDLAKCSSDAVFLGLPNSHAVSMVKLQPIKRSDEKFWCFQKRFLIQYCKISGGGRSGTFSPTSLRDNWSHPLSPPSKRPCLHLGYNIQIKWKWGIFFVYFVWLTTSWFMGPIVGVDKVLICIILKKMACQQM